MSKKVKLYLDTSIISHLDHKDTPDRTRETLMLWDAVIAGENE